jgi:hypothetical protein
LDLFHQGGVMSQRIFHRQVLAGHRVHLVRK